MKYIRSPDQSDMKKAKMNIFAFYNDSLSQIWERELKGVGDTISSQPSSG
jgi:hypothetical protein